jgi:predicted GNAT family N-acyltransferase
MKKMPRVTWSIGFLLNLFHLTIRPRACRSFNPAAMRQRVEAGNVVLVAATPERLVGVIEIRDYTHISLLFVDRVFQGRRISRELLNRALDVCRQHNPDLREMTVNASPNAVTIYTRLGFFATGDEQEKNGIRFTPMVLKIGQIGP